MWVELSQVVRALYCCDADERRCSGVHSMVMCWIHGMHVVHMMSYVVARVYFPRCCAA